MPEPLQSIAPEAWIIVAGVVLLVGAGSFVWGRRSGANAAQIRELTGALEEARSQADSTRQELETYRGSVADHFAETSEKLRDLTLQYRSVYDHLAAGANALCPEGFERLEDGLAAARLPDPGAGESAEEEGASGNGDAVPEAAAGEGPADAEPPEFPPEPPLETDRGTA